MRITLLELVEYNRLMLHNIQHFKFKPTELYQLILGTNGSGKSSIMNELTPWPADPNDFSKEGFKAIEIVDRGSKYRLTSEFRNKVVHTFEKDGENLNPGGTTNVQKQLVEQYFKINQKVHELLMCRDRFTSMGPSERREWFTRLSEVNYDFAIETFKQLTTEGRDVQGSLRRAKNSLVTETEKIITKEEEDRLALDVEELEHELTTLTSQHNPQYPIPNSFATKGAELKATIVSLATRALKTQIIKPDGGECACLQDVDDQIHYRNNELVAAETELNIHVKNHDRIEKVVDALRKAGADGIAALKAKLEPLRAERDGYFAKQRLKLLVGDPFEATAALGTISESLNACFQALPSNEDRRFTQARLTALREEAADYANDLETMRNKLAKLNANKDHMDGHKTTGGQTCPKCSHKWVVGFTDVAYENTLEEIAETESVIAHRTNCLAEVNLNIEQVVEYGNTYREFTRCVMAWPVLQPLWDHLLSEKLVVNYPAKASSTLLVFQQDLVFAQEAHRCEKELFEIMKIIAAASESEGTDLEEALDELADLDSLVSDTTAKILVARKQIGLWAGYKTQMIELHDIANRMESLIRLTWDTVEGEAEGELHQLLKRLINNAQSSLVRKRETLQNVRQQRAVVRALEQQIVNDTEEDAAYRALIKELSPTEGLIAEGLLGFIRNFTGQMNHLIRKIWSYPLQVLPCGGNSDTSADLDYKFPLMVNSHNNVVPDIKRGSSGQKEIVDLAFKVVAMRYMGLQESPLFLDEFGASFDEAHRNSAMSVVKTLMEQQSFTQLFMVSHYEGNHGALTNAEVLVLCAANITVPTKYNQHAELN